MLAKSCEGTVRAGIGGVKGRAKGEEINLQFAYTVQPFHRSALFSCLWKLFSPAQNGLFKLLQGLASGILFVQAGQPKHEASDAGSLHMVGVLPLLFAALMSFNPWLNP